TLFRSPAPGPTGVLPRVGFNPNKLVKEAGIRIEPPPSLAPAAGTIPLAIAAAAPPLDPPGECSVFQGLRVGPYNSGSVIFFNANSGTLVCPVMMKPASRSFFIRWESVSAITPSINRDPDVIVSPSLP